MQGLVDTHCHIHTAGSKRSDFTVRKWHEAGEQNTENLLASAQAGGVSKLICVGTDYEDSVEAAEFVQNRESVWAALGVHPHEAKKFLEKHKNLNHFDAIIKKPRVVAVGEVGLDYFYEYSPKNEQIKLLEMFLDLAQKNNLPIIFHVREAFEDFWPVLANFKAAKGVLHSFTSNTHDLDRALDSGLYIGLNGIMTFTKDDKQLDMAKRVPPSRLLLETDAPYLAPKPFRGKICKPEYISETYKFLSQLRSEDEKVFIDQIARNANQLFGL